MKKTYFLTAMLILILAVFYGAAFAEGVPIDELSRDVIVEETEGTLVDWAYLGTSAGAIAATLLIVQLLKAPLDKVFHIPTRVFVYIISLVIMLCAALFTNGITEVGDVLLIAFNAVGVSLSTMGAYELTFAKVDS